MNQPYLARAAACAALAVTAACSSGKQSRSALEHPEPAATAVAQEPAANTSETPTPPARAADADPSEAPEQRTFERDTTPLFEDARSLQLVKTTWAMDAPFSDSQRLGLVGGGTRVAALSHVENDDCETPWIEIAPRGWVCVRVKPSRRPPTAQRPARRVRAMPGSYAIASKGARFYKTAEAAELGEGGRRARGDMVRRRGTLTLDDGRVLWKTDRGEYVEASSVRRLWGSRFRGVDLTADDAPELPFAFAVNARSPRQRVRVRRSPEARARVVKRLPRRAVVDVLEHSEDGLFVRVGDRQWIARADLRIVERAEAPEDADGQRWIDVDLDQQLVVAYDGDEPMFATLGSSGKGEHATPTGTYRITRKKRQTTMRSDRSRRQTYSVAVPWPVYFNEGYAFHSTYWHDGFGTPRSHGCVNLSPGDATTIYEFVGPEMPPGWQVVYGHDSQPGTLVRVRSAQEPDAEAPRVAGR